MVTGVLAIDTTGLPPGGTFGASSGLGANAGTQGIAEPEGDSRTQLAVTGAASVPSEAGPLKVGQSFGPRYHILKLLGAGGMGAVYQAWDAELSVAVALKVIRTSRRRVSSDLEKRFKNELLLARSVTHKNVVRIHDLGEIDATKYITMSYVQGEDLATLLRKSGKFDVGRTLRLARQIATGLEAAHDAGVVHRDLKPANIMIGAEDHALIMDFGISASTDEAASGGIVGTLEYMAPEQGAGQVVDARADIYAFGLIVYEMLLGPRAMTATTAQERINAMLSRVRDGVPSPRSIDESIPEALEALVVRCLQQHPSERFETTAELCAALARLDDNGELLPELTKVSKRVMAAGVVVVLALLTGTYFVGLQRRPAVPVKRPIVPVLVTDFENRSGDATFDGPLGAQALSIALEGAPFVQLYSVRDARALAEQLSETRSNQITASTGLLIARREAIKVLVEGTIDKRPSGYRVTVRAIDPANESTVVSASEDAAQRGAVLTAIDHLAKRVRLALGESKTEMDKVAAAETFTASSLDAMRAYARGQDLASTGKLQEAVAAYREAIAADPQLGRAYAGLAVIYRNLGDNAQKEASFNEALKYIDRMTEREKYRTLGSYYIGVARNYPKAIETYDAFVAKYPGDQAGLSNLALANVYVGNFDRAVEVSKQLVEMYPNYLLGRNNYAAYALYAGDFTTAITETTKVLEQNPSYQFAFLPLALANLSNGDANAGLETYARLERLNAFGASLAKLGVADAAMYRGRYREAVTSLVAAIAADEKASNASAAAAKYVALADAYTAIGRRDPALAAARKAAAAGSDESVLFPTALTLIASGRDDDARKIAARLDVALENQPRSYARLIEGEVARRQQRTTDAVDAFREAQKRHDSWWSRLLLGRMYVEIGRPAEALAELELAVKRRGEGADAFMADTPTLRYVPPAYYWLGRAQEGVRATPAARRSYDQFLALRGESDVTDPLVADVRQRLRQP